MLSHSLSLVIAIVSILNVAACGWLIWWTARKTPEETANAEVKNHVWDGDLEEGNNPMPRWWLWLFYLTIIFCLVYFLLYPALGTFGNLLGWSKAGQYEQEMAAAKSKYGPIYAAFAGRDIVDLAKDPPALALGRSLFANNCAGCHGSDGRGAVGFPNLTGALWRYGGDPDTLVKTITYGREGMMPPLGAALGEQGVQEVEAYVLSLSGRKEPPEKVAAGQARFGLCASCHGVDAKGNSAIGAPNLAAGVWLYGGSEAAIHETIANGRHDQMPVHQWMGPDKIRLLAAYVYSLSHSP